MNTPPDNMDEVVVTKDSYVVRDILSPDEATQAYNDLRKELPWSEMYHKGGAVPRLVCIQGEVFSDGDGGLVEPIYRHPADEQPQLYPWTPTVQKLMTLVSQKIHQPLNHALIQLYRSGDDCISEHADKTLDVKRGSAVVNLSLGALRTMVLRPKKDQVQQPGVPRQSTRIDLPPGSVFVLGWETNRTMTHEIRRDKRDDKFKTPEELDFGGCRISLTFRRVATFQRQKDGSLYGQGAVSASNNNTEEDATKNNPVDEEEALIRAFSIENKTSNYDWDELYGRGFSVVNFKTINQVAQQQQAQQQQEEVNEIY